MFYKQLTTILSGGQDPFAPVPQQMTLFPDDLPGRDLEKLKIKTLLKNFYKKEHNENSDPEFNKVS